MTEKNGRAWSSTEKIKIFLKPSIEAIPVEMKTYSKFRFSAFLSLNNSIFIVLHILGRICPSFNYWNVQYIFLIFGINDVIKLQIHWNLCPFKNQYKYREGCLPRIGWGRRFQWIRRFVTYFFQHVTITSYHDTFCGHFG